MPPIKEFITQNFKTLTVIVSFVVTMYVQHLNNTSHILELKEKCSTLELKIQDQYEKIDAIKLDKTVFEATMTQFSAISTDIREIRADIKELLKTHP